MPEVSLFINYTDEEYQQHRHAYLTDYDKHYHGRGKIFGSAGFSLLAGIGAHFNPGPIADLLVIVAVAFLAGCWFLYWSAPRQAFISQQEWQGEIDATFCTAGVRMLKADFEIFVPWAYYQGWSEEKDSFYLPSGDQDNNSATFIPKRAFINSEQMETFRQLLEQAAQAEKPHPWPPESQGAGITISIPYTDQELIRERRKKMGGARSLCLSLILFPACLFLTYWGMNHHNLYFDVVLGWLLGVSTLYLLMHFWYVPHKVGKQTQWRTLTETFCDEGIRSIYAAPPISVVTDWSAYQTWEEDKNTIYLLNEAEQNPIPKRVFADEDTLNAFRQLLEQKLGPVHTNKNDEEKNRVRSSYKDRAY